MKLLDNIQKRISPPRKIAIAGTTNLTLTFAIRLIKKKSNMLMFNKKPLSSMQISRLRVTSRSINLVKSKASSAWKNIKVVGILPGMRSSCVSSHGIL